MELEDILSGVCLEEDVGFLVGVPKQTTSSSLTVKSMEEILFLLELLLQVTLQEDFA